MLILACAGLINEAEEIESINLQAKLYDIEVTSKFIKNEKELFDTLKESVKYDYVYLSAHGDENGFSDNDGEIDIKWTDFGESLNDNDCLAEDSHLLLSCCRGGLNDVAYDLINFCSNIAYIVGPRNNLTTEETLMGFNSYLYSVEYRELDPVIATEKIRSFIDLRYICFDSLEVKTEPAYLMRMNDYEINYVDKDNDGIKDELIIRKIGDNGTVYSEEDSLHQAELTQEEE